MAVVLWASCGNFFLIRSNAFFVRLRIAIVAMAVIASTAVAEPYYGKAFTYSQPDGEKFTVRLWGDEFFAYHETEDGYLIVQDPRTGIFCYANVTARGGDIVSTGVRVGRARPPGLHPKQRLAPGDDESVPGEGLRFAPPGFQVSGKRMGLVLAASFPDLPGDISKTKEQIDAYCNNPNYTRDGNATSIYGYYLMQSNGKLEYRNVVTAWFTAANNRSYYTDPGVTTGIRAKELIKEGLAILQADGFDFTQCDANGNTYIDGVSCFYA